ncbi:MAG: NUDIX domain-containing protein [Pseudomonadota bacterium]
MAKLAVRPHDAAGLIVVRPGARGLEVLLGKRHPKSRFMPSVYVFPGGRVSAVDRRASGFDEDFAAPPEGLDQATRRAHRTLARTAIRETFEETGMVIGAPAEDRSAPPEGGGEPVWRAYRTAGVRPPFGGLRLVARAITPSYSPIRFHTRFFRLDCGLATTAAAGDGELVDVHWAPIDRLAELPMSSVTHLVLEEALAHSPGRPAARFAWASAGDRPLFRRAPLPDSKS